MLIFIEKQMMGAVDKFLHKLINFDKENIPSKVVNTLQTYLDVYLLHNTKKYNKFIVSFKYYS